MTVAWRWAKLVVAVGIATLGAGAAMASDPGYLPDKSIEADLGYSVPPPPDNKSEMGRLDLAMVEMAQTRDPAAYDEAYRDAGAYSFDRLIGRFSPAAGTELSVETSPILAHILKLVLNDTGAYASLAKNAGPRARPYVENPDIVPCATDYLRASDGRSYPSGHSTNGYAAALVLAEVMPARASKLLARGIRYGDNRVVCGVHHPIDVQQGRLLAIAIFAKLKLDPAFREDVACARQAYDRSLAGTEARKPLDPSCAALDAKYRAELKLPTKP
ncbi:phosphatase PAP2 family protein [Sphingomonas sp.]|uniref:acid phosphatase n=1 Tax=Sphingomonas sp. TaxID=28214 RepID=UPI001B02A100|nr:phosphatase PAP2 family protein [Sphingomonas sp.]MBO9711288.1 phosphatase PAP2 family protein [Sphingomonas sp.]